ncbi:MAG: LUD domain-containing protein, partial [Bacteroidota bacterium]|nr:LUD domain-containing protein [Kiloniellaceae bacterium]
LRAELGPGVMPRAVNMVTGPSRTGDIEQTILLGAHGPRRLHVLLVDDRPPGPAAAPRPD